MKFGISKKLRDTLEGLTGFKFADTAIGAVLSQNEKDAAERQREMQIALQELRTLVVETISFEMTMPPDPAGDSEIAPVSIDSTNFALVDSTGDLLDPTIENHSASNSTPGLLDSITGRSLTVLAQQA